MESKAYFLVFDGLADWEGAQALCEINKSGKFEVMSVGFSKESVTTMGGLKVVPDISLKQVKPDEAAIFILPGGDRWEQTSHPELSYLLQTLNQRGVTIAAICGATLEVARAGLTRELRHTSNTLAYLQAIVPDYEDEELYVDAFAVSDKHLITANGLGSVEFGREIVKKLGIYSEADAEAWFEMFKHGKYAVLH